MPKNTAENPSFRNDSKVKPVDALSSLPHTTLTTTLIKQLSEKVLGVYITFSLQANDGAFMKDHGVLSIIGTHTIR